jgi:hypothetical protein
VSDALQTAEKKIDDGTIVVSGSVYLVGEARSILLGNRPIPGASIPNGLLQEHEAQP